MRQEPDRLPRRLVWITGVISAVVFAVALAVVTAMRPAPKVAPPRPASSVDQGPILRATAPREPLDRWAWVDREQGVVRMPIETAMRLVEAGR